MCTDSKWITESNKKYKDGQNHEELAKAVKEVF